MVISTSQENCTHFLVKRSQINTSKIFVEYYLPKFQEKIDALSNAPYPLKSLKKVASRLFDGPFGSNRKVDMYQDSGVPYIRVKDVLPTGIDLSDIKYISEEKHQELNRSRVVPGNVLITIAGRVGTAAVFPDSLEEGNITGHIAGIEVPEDINPHYIAAFLNSQFGVFQVARLSHRTTPEMNLKEVGSILVSVPPRSIQDQIAQVMQEAYSDQGKKLEEAQQILKSIDSFILETLDISFDDLNHEKRFLISSNELISTRFDVGFHLPKIHYQYKVLKRSKKCRILSLGSLIEQLANGATPKGANYLDEGIPFLRIQNIEPDGLDLSDIVYISRQTHDEMKRSQTRSGDLLMTITGRVGTAAVISDSLEEGNINQHIVIIRLKQNVVNLSYLATVINSSVVSFQVDHRTTGTTRIALDYSAIKSLLIPIPAIEIQEQLLGEVARRRGEAKHLRSQAEAVVTVAKARVERMILGEDIMD